MILFSECSVNILVSYCTRRVRIRDKNIIRMVSRYDISHVAKKITVKYRLEMFNEHPIHA